MTSLDNCSSATNGSAVTTELVPVLDDAHRQQLHASGLSDDMIAAAGIYSAEGEPIRQILGWQPSVKPWGRGMVIPFTLPNGGPSYARVKLDQPRIAQDQSKIKYESPVGQPNHAYFPPRFWESVQDPATKILVTEGEKKALAAQQAGYACIGLVGIWGAFEARQRRQNGESTGIRTLIDELNRFQWGDRDVYIVFDSDAEENIEIQRAEFELAGILEGRGARVRIARLRPLAEGKTGLDDFLVHHGSEGPAELDVLLQRARLASEIPFPKELRPQPKLPLPWADDFITKTLMHPDGPILRHFRDNFHLWDGTRYRVFPNGELESAVLEWADTRATGVRPRFAREICECLKARIGVPGEIDQPCWLGDAGGPEQPSDWISLLDGRLDLRAFLQTGKVDVQPHSPLWFSPTCLPYNYDPSATCPNWERFLAETLDEDQQRMDLLAEWFGYCVTTETKHQAILLLVGPPRSGKGTITRMLRRVVGEDNCVNPRLNTLGETFGLWGLLDKRCALCPDAHLGHGDRALAVLELLKSISGEDAIEVHRKNLASVTARLNVRFTLAVNELPRFGDGSNALLSRVQLLPLHQSFTGKEDRDLDKRLEPEAAGVFNWALQGLQRLHTQGRFTRPTVSNAIIDEFARLSSPIKAFLDDCCEIAPNASCETGDLWQAWQSWCSENGSNPGTREQLGSSLRSQIPTLLVDRPRERSGGGRARRYKGVGLQPEALERMPGAHAHPVLAMTSKGVANVA